MSYARTQVLERHVHPKFPRLRIELRSDSKFFQAVTRLDNRLRQKSTGTDRLETAFRLAEDWYRREVKASQAAARQHPVDLILRGRMDPECRPAMDFGHTMEDENGCVATSWFPEDRQESVNIRQAHDGTWFVPIEHLGG